VAHDFRRSALRLAEDDRAGQGGHGHRERVVRVEHGGARSETRRTGIAVTREQLLGVNAPSRGDPPRPKLVTTASRTNRSEAFAQHAALGRGLEHGRVHARCAAGARAIRPAAINRAMRTPLDVKAVGTSNHPTRRPRWRSKCADETPRGWWFAVVRWTATTRMRASSPGLNHGIDCGGADPRVGPCRSTVRRHAKPGAAFHCHYRFADGYLERSWTLRADDVDARDIEARSFARLRWRERATSG